ncbi:hypothetical protein FPZ12_014075 [Amycolatopsis acidicola]|uniref:Uncharacterized protein n=1 Tax=Amycolatopsis acidicola TaxID=2596893 RepID=A0A5N0V9H8_9PSEU|nr:hypothetical protein [Amycolatopsis acidicola]KAA9161631.1 hypothetical protein FPZ12_014075 [Amycolatopsis acidicola]
MALVLQLSPARLTDELFAAQPDSAPQAIRIRLATLSPTARRVRAAPVRNARSRTESEDLRQTLRLEYARSVLPAGHQGRAREMAGEVAAVYHVDGRHQHARCAEAEVVLADAGLPLDIRDLRARTVE